MNDFRPKLIALGVKNLKASYPGVNETNILTDQIYKAFFRQMLEYSKGQAGQSKALDAAIDGLLQETA